MSKKTEPTGSFLDDVELEYEEEPQEKPTKKSKKVLTSPKHKSILKNVISKLKERTTLMASPETKTAKKTTAAQTIKSLAWLVEAGFRGFVGWVLLTNFDQLVTTVAAIYALGTATLIVATHFVKAHK